MLTNLSIRDIVLIEQLDLTFEPGLCVLTGETGAGKSILLDALGLALGGRGERALVRPGATQGAAVAVFSVAAGDPVHDLLAEHGIEPEEPLVLRRVIGADGRSRAYVNDQPVGIGLLRRLGETLVEVHGQHDQQSLLDGPTQRSLLDAFGRLEPLLGEVRGAHRLWRELEAEHAALAGELERAAAEAAYLRHAAEELSQLAPEPGEEAVLVETRARLMNREKLAAAIQEASDLLRAEGGVDARLGAALRGIERVLGSAGTLLQGAAEALERTRVEAEEAGEALERAAAELELESDRLEQIEERLFAIRAAARKYRVEVDALAALRQDMTERLGRIDSGAERVTRAAEAVLAARAGFVEHAARLSHARGRVADALGGAVMAELPPLKLDKARFVVRLQPLAEGDWSAEGAERIAFEVATNPGQEPGPLARIASGGELARFMLALKVVLARTGSTASLVFDEVDTGIGGATADAVGERLSRLGRSAQVLVVTHAPQVAARADHHVRVEKRTAGGRAVVSAVPLAAATRREEIARMLAGATVTDAARAAADSLIERPA
jgi:DNA repair protein RecN (Recombination protein N)